MEDPFPAAPGFVATATAPLARALNLHTLPLHAHEIAGAAIFYTIVKLLSPRISTALAPNVYPRLPRRTRLSWDVHVVSFVQSMLINVLALGLMIKDRASREEMDATERVWAYTGAGGLIQAMAAGYFLWDLIVTAMHTDVFGPGMLAHAISAFTVYMLGFRPFVNFYAPNFVLYELSSPFLNIHWFLDKVNLTGSRWQWYNGMILISTFFGCRLVWGSYASFSVFRDIFAARSLSGLPNPSPSVAGIVYSSPTSLAGAIQAMQAGDTLSFARIGGKSTNTTAGAVPLWLEGAYLSANLTLNTLNWYWFSRMIETVRKRFRQAPEEALADAKKEEEKLLTANGVRKPNGSGSARGKSAADGHADAAASGADASNTSGHARRRSRADSSLVLEQMAEAAELVRRRVVEGEIAPAEEGDELEAQ